MSKIQDLIKREEVWGFFVSVAAMAIVSLAFFLPDNIEGRSLRQADVQQGAANGQEGIEYFEATGEKALWTNSLFGGMPTFQISPEYESNRMFSWINKVYGAGLPAPSNLLFMMMLGMLILLYAMKMRWYYALLGSIAWGFSTYFVIIIGAGHIWKFITLAYIPPTIAGLVICYRGRYLLGGALTALFATMQLYNNHPQMSYYFAFVMAALVIAWLVEAISKKEIKRWGIATAVTIIAGALAVGANAPSLYHTYKYAKETKRSQSELTAVAENTDPTAPKPTGGMPYTDIVGWSYGRTETFSLLIPNIKGGATAKPVDGHMVAASLAELDDAADYAEKPVGMLLNYLPQYFNDSEGTNGPVYVGALIFALFLVGCFVVKGPVKYALVVMTLLSILLAWGANFSTLTDFMIYHFPLYNKFRAVESILVIAEFSIPLLAVLTLCELMKKPAVGRTVLYVFASLSFICLLFALFPSLSGSAITEQDRAMSDRVVESVVQYAQQSGYSVAEAHSTAFMYSIDNAENAEAISSLRYGLVRGDAFRSLLILVLGGGVILLYMYGKLKSASVVVTSVVVITLIDLYSVNKRYVNHESFASSLQEQAYFTPDPIDNLILQDTTYYRVMDATSGFYSPNRSYFHKMLGGYHAAKLNRYEDLIRRQLAPLVSVGWHNELREDTILAQYAGEERQVAEMVRSGMRVCDMLNAKYVIVNDPVNPVVLNTHALGNAWFIDSIKYVDNADAEMAALSLLNPATQAVADRKFAGLLHICRAAPWSSRSIAHDTIYLTAYSPNTLSYKSNTATDRLAVFSEVYFPWGWHATIDGEDTQIARVNYILRAIKVPAGEHEIVFTFKPASLQTTATVAYTSISLIYLALIFATIPYALRIRRIRRI